MAKLVNPKTVAVTDPQTPNQRSFYGITIAFILRSIVVIFGLAGGLAGGLVGGIVGSLVGGLVGGFFGGLVSGLIYWWTRNDPQIVDPNPDLDLVIVHGFHLLSYIIIMILMLSCLFDFFRTAQHDTIGSLLRKLIGLLVCGFVSSSITGFYLMMRDPDNAQQFWLSILQMVFTQLRGRI